MAGKAINFSFARMSARGLAAQAAANPETCTPPAPEINCTVLSNKLMVSTLDTCGPLSRVTIAFRTGPRNETYGNLGVTHVIRSMVGASTKVSTGFAILRNLQQNGVHLTCTGDREVTAFNIVAARSQISSAFKYLNAVVSCPAFKLWQIRDSVPQVEYQVRTLPPHAKLMEALHKVCYRDGLGNPLFVNKEYLGSHTPEMVSAFYKKGFTANRASVVGYNVSHKDMLDFAESLDLKCDDPYKGNSTYFGGELRLEKRSYFANIAVATEGIGLQDIKEVLVYGVLQHAYGVSPNVAWGGSPSPLYSEIYPEAPDAGVSCFNFNYSDSGLFGVVISASAATAGKALLKAVKVLRSGCVSEEDFNRGKAMLKMNLLSGLEDTECMTQNMVSQSLNGDVIVPGPVLAEAIDKITYSDVNSAAKHLSRKNLSIAARGDLNLVPYLSDLC